MQGFVEADVIGEQARHFAQAVGHAAAPLLGAIQVGVVDGGRDDIGYGFEDQPVVFGESIGAVGLDVEQADHFLIEDQRHAQLGADIVGRQGRGTIARLLRHVVGEHGLPIARRPRDNALRFIEREGESLQVFAPPSAAGLVFNRAAVGMHRKHVDKRIAKLFLNELRGVAHQLGQVKRGAHAVADFGNQSQLVGAAAQVAIEARALHRAGDRVGQRFQHEQVVGMEGMRLVALHIQHAQHALFDFERQGDFGLGLRQEIDKTIARILPDLVAELAFPTLGGLPDQSLTQAGLHDDGLFPAPRPRRGGAGAEAQRPRARLEREEGHVIIVKRLLDELGHAAGELVQFQHIGDLRAYPADEVQLLEAETFHRGAMRSVQPDGGDGRKPLERVEFSGAKRFGAVHLERAQHHALVRNGQGDPVGFGFFVGTADLSALPGAAQPAGRRVGGEQGRMLPVGQAEQLLVQPERDAPIHQAAGHLQDARLLRGQGVRARQLFSQAGQVAPLRGVGTMVNSRGHASTDFLLIMVSVLPPSREDSKRISSINLWIRKTPKPPISRSPRFPFRFGGRTLVMSNIFPWS